VARGTAARLDYRRAGGQFIAGEVAATVVPEAGSGPAAFGELRLSAPHVEGEVANKRGNAWGGVVLDTGRGDHAVTEAVAYDGAILRSVAPVAAHGPGYTVESHGLVAQADGSAVELTSGVQGKLQMKAQP